MYQIGICDDEPIFIQHITGQISGILSAHNIPCKIHSFQTLAELQAHMQHSLLDLLLLDILLEKENGMDFARQLRMAGSDIPIIFITCSMDFVLDGYMVEPSGYLIKPVEPERLTHVLLGAYKKYSKKQVIIETPTQTFSLNLKEILYLEIMNKKLSIHMLDGSVLEALIPLNLLLQKLPGEQFVQCHRSYVVSLPSICSIRRYVIELKNHESIPVSKRNYKRVQNALLLWAASLE